MTVTINPNMPQARPLRPAWAPVGLDLSELPTFVFGDESMAPAFPKGCRVAVRPVECRCALHVGAVLVRVYRPEPGLPGRVVGVGRLAEARHFPHGTFLQLTRDNAPNTPWEDVPFRYPLYQWYRVDFLLSLPIG